MTAVESDAASSRVILERFEHWYRQGDNAAHVEAQETHADAAQEGFVGGFRAASAPSCTGEVSEREVAAAYDALAPISPDLIDDKPVRAALAAAARARAAEPGSAEKGAPL